MKRKSSALPTIRAASAEALQKARVALGEKRLTRMEEIEADKKFIAEIPKQIRSKAQLEKYFEEEASKLLKQEEERKRWIPQESSADDTPEMVYSLEECDYEEGDENGNEEDAAPPAVTDGNGNANPPKNIVSPWMKPGYDNYADEKIRFQYHQFDPGLRREGVTTARSLPDHIFEALKLHQAIVGPAAVALAQSSWNQITTKQKFIESVTGNSDEDATNKNLGFGFEPGYKSINATSREVTPENAWVFSDERMQDFIVRLMEDDKIAIYEKNPDDALGVANLFKRAIKAYFQLQFFYRIHTSDLGFTEMEGLQVPRGLWKIGPDGTDIAAKKMHRKRLLRDGIALYGAPPDWKPLDAESIARSKKLWDLFERIRHQVIKPTGSTTCRNPPGKKNAQKAKK